MPRLVASEGVYPYDHVPDEEEVVERAEQTWERTRKIQKKRQNQKLVWESGPICLVFTADWHLGGEGVNWPRLRHDAELIADMPNTWVMVLGDIVDNFVVQRLLQVRNKARFSIRDEWALATFALKLLGPKLIACVAGNHDLWTLAMAGIDFFEETLERINPECLYDRDDSLIQVTVGDEEYLMRVRHKWSGSSIYNPTHGIERAAKFEFPFNIGVGAHTHTWGVARQFRAAKREAIAIQVGTYKEVDDFGRSISGVPSQRPSIALIIDDETNSLTGYSQLERAKEIMEKEEA